MIDKIQVAIPTYDRDSYLDKLLSTIPSDIKVSVSDNNSKTSSNIIDKYSNATFYSHVDVLDVFSNWNVAVKNVDSEWVIIPSDDDLFLKQSFSTIAFYIEKYPKQDILIFGHHIIDENNHFSDGWKINKEIVFNAPFGYSLFKYGVSARMPSVVFKVSFLKELGYFDERFKLTAGDSDLIQRALLTGRVTFIPEIISAYRIWQGALTSRKIGTSLWLEEIDLWQNKIQFLGKKVCKGKNIKLNFNHIKDEIYARNLIGGINAIKKLDGFKKAVFFVFQNRYPFKAKLKTQIKIWMLLISIK